MVELGQAVKINDVETYLPVSEHEDCGRHCPVTGLEHFFESRTNFRAPKGRVHATYFGDLTSQRKSSDNQS